MTLEPAQPFEVRGDQFETATPPVHVQQMEVEREEKEETEEEEDSVTHFDHSNIEIDTGETSTDTITHPTVMYSDIDDLVTDSNVYVHAVPGVLTEFESIKTQEQSDQTATGATTTMTPYKPHVSSLSPTTPSGPVPPGVSQPVASAAFVYGDMEGSASHSTNDPSHEGSTGDVLPTPAADSLALVMTDEAEIGGTEFPTFIPQTQSQDTTTQTQMEEGSASGEEDDSGQEVYPPETPALTSTLLPTYSTLHTQQPRPAAGTDATEVPVGLPAVDTLTETGSGSEPPSREREVSGEQRLVDLSGEVAVTVLPTVAAVGWQTTLATNIDDITSESSTVKPSSYPSLAATDDNKLPTVATTKPAPTTSDVHTTHPTKPYRDQRPESTTSSSQYVSQSILSTTSPLYTFDQSTYSVPKWALTPDPAATSLPDDDFPDYDKNTFLSVLESRPQVPEEPVATEQPETSTDSAYTRAANTVNITGTCISLLVV